MLSDLTLTETKFVAHTYQKWTDMCKKYGVGKIIFNNIKKN
jgi:hypothetical protein